MIALFVSRQYPLCSFEKSVEYVLVQEEAPLLEEVTTMANNLDTSDWVVSVELLENFVVCPTSCLSHCFFPTIDLRCFSRERTFFFSNVTPSGAHVRTTSLLSSLLDTGTDS